MGRKSKKFIPPKPFTGPRLVDAVIEMIEEKGLGNHAVAEKFGVGTSWLSNVRNGYIHAPNADTLQFMYEELTGEPLLRERG